MSLIYQQPSEVKSTKIPEVFKAQFNGLVFHNNHTWKVPCEVSGYATAHSVFHTLFSPVSIILQLQDTLFSHFES
jgi:hypothetical protein